MPLMLRGNEKERVDTFLRVLEQQIGNEKDEGRYLFPGKPRISTA